MVYGTPSPELVEAGADALQTSPLVPGSTALEALAPESLERAVMAAPPGTLERRYVQAQALRALKPGGELIVLAPKAFDLDDSLESVALASARGAVLPFHNGLAHIKLLDEKFGRDRVMGGVAQIAGTITETGAVRQLTDLAALTVGPRSQAHEDLAKAFYDLCENAGFDRTYSENIEQNLWDKWIFLATLAGMTTLFGGTVGEIVAAPWGAEMMTKAFGECCAIAQAHGFPMRESARERSGGMLTKPGSAFAASMLRDMRAGNRTEHDHILGDMIAHGMERNLPCDLIKAAHTHLCVEQARRKS